MIDTCPDVNCGHDRFFQRENSKLHKFRQNPTPWFESAELFSATFFKSTVSAFGCEKKSKETQYKIAAILS